MKKPSEEFSNRLATAKKWRAGVRPFIEDIFKHCAPGRENDFTTNDRYKRANESQIFHSLGEEMATDLASDLVTYFTPAEAQWASYAVISEVDEDAAAAVQKIVTEREKDLFDLIQMSNYNDISPQWAFEAATHGTPAMWITQSGPMTGLHFEVVPPHQLYITPGHAGYLDRFREVTIPANTLAAALAMPDIEVDLSNPKIANKMKKVGQNCTVVWGFWLDWSDPGRPQWMTEITVDGHLVTDQKVVLGEMNGSCPLVLGRFNPQVGRPWGRGPGWKALPDLRTLDKIDEIVLSGLDQALSNTLIYPDDGFLDMSEGIDVGAAYPASKGFTRDQIYELNKTTNLDLGFYTEEAFQERIRMAFYQERVQRGDTPPSATQYVDERRRTQQRIGKPSAPLWTEMIVPMIQRIEMLGVASGKLPEALSHNGQDILITPVSPLQKAQNADQVVTARSNLEMAFAAFQDQTMNIVDGVATFKNVIEASGDKLTVIREQEREPEVDQPPAAPPQ
jgi:hypothetical protein